MFYSLMALLHERLPCAKNFYRLRQIYRKNDPKYLKQQNDNASPVRTIASPNLINGLKIKTKAYSLHDIGLVKNNAIQQDVRIKTGSRKGSIKQEGMMGLTF